MDVEHTVQTIFLPDSHTALLMAQMGREQVRAVFLEDFEDPNDCLYGYCKL